MLEHWLTFPVFFPSWLHQGGRLNKVPISLQHFVPLDCLQPGESLSFLLPSRVYSFPSFSGTPAPVVHGCWHLFWWSLQHRASWCGRQLMHSWQRRRQGPLLSGGKHKELLPPQHLSSLFPTPRGVSRLKRGHWKFPSPGPSQSSSDGDSSRCISST